MHSKSVMAHDETAYHVFTADFYRRLSEGSDMSMSSGRTMRTRNGSSWNASVSGGSVTMSSAESSVGSNNNSLHTVLMHPDLKTRTSSWTKNGTSASYSSMIEPSSTVTRGSVDDSLAGNLMDDRYPSEGLEGYEEWTISLKRLHLGLSFAQGAFGRLYKGTYAGRDVAVKILARPENNLERSFMMEKQFSAEVTMLANTKHKNVVRFIGACRKPMVWCIVTEYAKGGSLLSSLSRRSSRSSLRVVVQQALDVARGMEYLHSLEIIHRDLKSDNLLIADDKSIKIADFGAARIEVKPEFMTPETGTYRWMAPEMIQHRPYNHKVDVYSFGIVLWELVTGLLPFQNMTAVQAAFAVVNKGMRPGIPADCPPALVEIMCRCWDANPDVRPEFAQVVRRLEEIRVEIMSNGHRADSVAAGCSGGSITDFELALSSPSRFYSF